MAFGCGSASKRSYIRLASFMKSFQILKESTSFLLLNKSLEFYPTRAKEIKQKRKEMRQNIGQRDSKSFVAGFEDEGRES